MDCSGCGKVDGIVLGLAIVDEGFVMSCKGKLMLLCCNL